MKIITLLENNSSKKELKSSHGLSLYIEVGNKKILFDIGSNNNYKKNAKILGIDLNEVDTLIISHGHYDHGKKLRQFVRFNKNAEIYLSKYAFEKHTALIKGLHFDIGIKEPKKINRLHFVKGKIPLFEGVFLTSLVPYEETIMSDKTLYSKNKGKREIDTFHHEIYLVIQEKENIVLFSACSHKGIDNIITTIEKDNQIKFTHVLGGFHFIRYNEDIKEQTDFITSLGKKFKNTDTTYFACHCTGDTAFHLLNDTMDNLKSLHTGDVVVID